MATYDPKVLYGFADRLYTRAAQIVITTAIIGLLIGGVAGYAIGLGFHGPFKLYAIFGALLGGVLGYSTGTERAFQLRLQAQTALCQVKIEENTRRG